MTETQIHVGGSGPSPTRVLLLVLGLVFGVEISIMLIFTAFPGLVSGDFLRSLVDAATLTAVIAPALWMIVVRPLRALFEERGLLLYRVIHSQERERASLARDLHDDVGQHLMVVLLGISAAERATDLDSARSSLREVRAMTTRSVEAVRRLARGLGPGVLEGLGLRAAVERLCEDLSSTSPAKFEVSTNVDAGVRFEPDIEISVYRIAQEACTNVVKHAEATRAEIRLILTDEVLTLEVRDDGRGLEASAVGSGSGLGLTGIRERALSLGGEATVRSARGEGTTVRVAIPGVVVTGRGGGVEGSKP
ncbi:MAG: sensor histidine kinase [Tepidisphaera sp.]